MTQLFQSSTPIEGIIGKVPEIKDIETPDRSLLYPDPGSYYAGYSKRLIAGNKFELRGQTLWTYSAARTGLLSANPTILSFPGKAIYCTSLQILGWVEVVLNASFYSIDEGLNLTKFRWRSWLNESLTDPFPFCASFPTPLSFPGGLRVDFDNDIVSPNYFIINMSGWIEDIR